MEWIWESVLNHKDFQEKFREIEDFTNSEIIEEYVDNVLEFNSFSNFEKNVTSTFSKTEEIVTIKEASPTVKKREHTFRPIQSLL